MPEYSLNYNLIKPSEDDFYNIADFNKNTDLIDTELKKINDEVGTIDEIKEEDINSWIGEEVPEMGIGVEAINEMYEKDIVHETDTGIPDSEIDAMYK